MDATIALQLTQSSVAQALGGAKRPMSWRVAMLAQQIEADDEPAPTDVMVYRQPADEAPASDVPVPACWDPAPKTPDATRDDDACARSTADLDLFAAVDSGPVPVLQTSAWTGPQVAAWVLSSVVTCSLVSTVLLA